MARGSVEQISEHVFLLKDEIFPLYIIRGENNFLVDTGIGIKAPEFEKKIKNFLSGEPLHTLLLTHTHWDHTGGASYLQKKFDFNVMASKPAVELLQKEKVIQTIDRMNREVLKTAPGFVHHLFIGLQNLVPVADSDIFSIDDTLTNKVIATPGHTRCSASFFLEPDRILFPGDALGVMGKSGLIHSLFLSSYLSYESSILKIRETGPEILAFPHNRPLRGYDNILKHIDMVVNRTREIRDKILSLLKKSSDISAIARKFLKDEFSTPMILEPAESFIMNLRNLEAMVGTVKREKNRF